MPESVWCMINIDLTNALGAQAQPQCHQLPGLSGSHHHLPSFKTQNSITNKEMWLKGSWSPNSTYLHLDFCFCLDPSIWEFLFGGIPHFRNSEKPTFFLKVFGWFFYCFLLFHQQFVCEMPLLQKKLVHLTFSSRRTANCKVPRRIGGHHFLLCQHTTT